MDSPPPQLCFNATTPVERAPDVSGQVGNDWGVTQGAMSFEIEHFMEVVRDDKTPTVHVRRGIFSSNSSAFDQKK